MSKIIEELKQAYLERSITRDVVCTVAGILGGLLLGFLLK